MATAPLGAALEAQWERARTERDVRHIRFVVRNDTVQDLDSALAKGSDVNDFASMQQYLGNSPSFFLFRLDIPVDGREWIFGVYCPDIISQGKFVIEFSAVGDSLKKQLGDKYFVVKQWIGEKDDLNAAGFDKFFRSVEKGPTLPPPSTTITTAVSIVPAPSMDSINREWRDNAFPAEVTSLLYDPEDNQHPVMPEVWATPSEFTSQVALLEGISPQNIRSAVPGEQYLLAALSALAEVPSRIEQMFVSKVYSHGKSTSIVLYVTGHRVELNVDDLFPCRMTGNRRTLAYASTVQGQLWLPFLEKAFAKASGCYEGILCGGDPGLTMLELTGCPVEYVFSGAVEDAAMYSMLAQSDVAVCAVAMQMEEEIAARTGIEDGFVCSVAAVQTYNNMQLVKVRHPEGGLSFDHAWAPESPAWTPDARTALLGAAGLEPTSTWMTIADFRALFAVVCVAHCHERWHRTSLACKWVRRDGGGMSVAQADLLVVEPTEMWLTIVPPPHRLYMTSIGEEVDARSVADVVVRVRTTSGTEVVVSPPNNGQNLSFRLPTLASGAYTVSVHPRSVGSSARDFALLSYSSRPVSLSATAVLGPAVTPSLVAIAVSTSTASAASAGGPGGAPAAKPNASTAQGRSSTNGSGGNRQEPPMQLAPLTITMRNEGKSTAVAAPTGGTTPHAETAAAHEEDLALMLLTTSTHLVAPSTGQTRALGNVQQDWSEALSACQIGKVGYVLMPGMILRIDLTSYEVSNAWKVERDTRFISVCKENLVSVRDSFVSQFHDKTPLGGQELLDVTQVTVGVVAKDSLYFIGKGDDDPGLALYRVSLTNTRNGGPLLGAMDNDWELMKGMCYYSGQLFVVGEEGIFRIDPSSRQMQRVPIDVDFSNVTACHLLGPHWYIACGAGLVEVDLAASATRVIATPSPCLAILHVGGLPEGGGCRCSVM